ncbi:hypothetical protein Nepgr_022426 [Nepenthes gracilis]|uniref:Ubiquitin-like domain-containing protein n=1 Tax=Nepenthes gracilis TaxID=150966 RepID=A0AAD3SZI2_NEPGR|nr:hypothetical protein Nepgr_022426 [Nepenthes gracilis]
MIGIIVRPVRLPGPIIITNYRYTHSARGTEYFPRVIRFGVDQVIAWLVEMESSVCDITHDDTQNSGTTVEIKIKTMDSQTYTMRVDKQMSVPDLKEQIASMTGIVTEHQRLLCCGKVLKDDQLLSAYHVEDGHTIHLVVREPASSSAENLHNDPAIGSNTSQGQYYQVAPGIVVETFNMAGQGDRVLPDIGRIVSAVLGSIGVANPGTGGDGTNFRAIPDALETMTEYLSHMRLEYISNGRVSENNPEAAAMRRVEEREFNSASHSASSQEGLPTPASLAQLLLSTRQMLNQQTAECLLQLATQLENQASVVDPAARLSTQSGAWRTGVLLHNLGAYLLELGRTTMTLRLGRSPSQAVVNAGPAVFISSSRPNPIMVQPLPFQPGATFGAPLSGSLQTGSGSVNGLSSGFLPRRIDIQIRRGPSVNQPGSDGSQQPVAHSNSSTNGSGDSLVIQPTAATSDGLTSGTAVRVLPVRTMVAAIPDLNRSPPDSTGNSFGPYYPVLGRYQDGSPGNLSSITGSQVLGEHHPNGFQAEQQPTPESAAQRQNIEDSARNGQLPPPTSGQGDRLPTRSIDINILSAGGFHNGQNVEGQIPSGVLQFLSGLFPSGEIHVENVTSQEMAGELSAEHQRTSSAAILEEEPGATEEGLFLSRLLHEIMPFISPLPGAEPSAISPGEANASECTDGSASSAQAANWEGGALRRESDVQPEHPNPKRQKME